MRLRAETRRWRGHDLSLSLSLSLKEEPGPSKEKKPGPSKEKTPGPSTEEKLGPSTEKKPGPSKEKDAPIHFVTRHKAFNGSMPRCEDPDMRCSSTSR